MRSSRQSEYLQLLGLTEWTLKSATDASLEAVVVADASAQQPVVPQPAPQTREEPLVATPDEPVSQPAALQEPEPPIANVEPKPIRAIASEWEPLKAQVAACTACALHARRTQTVFGVGQQSAKLMLVGEGPGEQEDLRGEPFVGAAGQLLDRMLEAIGHSRQQTVYIANVVKCRPPGNRKPHLAEADACRGYLEAQIALVQPTLIVALGQVAAANLLGEDAPVGRLRHQVHEHTASGTPVIVTYHPAYYLRKAVEKRKGWVDLKKIRAHLKSAVQ